MKGFTQILLCIVQWYLKIYFGREDKNVLTLDFEPRMTIESLIQNNSILIYLYSVQSNANAVNIKFQQIVASIISKFSTINLFCISKLYTNLSCYSRLHLIIQSWKMLG